MIIEPVSDALHSAMLLGLIEKSGHSLPSVTHHLKMDDGYVTGAFCDEFMPVLFLWLDPDRWNPLAAFRAWKLIQLHYKTRGCEKMIIAIQPDSPFYYWAKKAGMPTLGDYQLLSHQLK